MILNSVGLAWLGTIGGGMSRSPSNAEEPLIALVCAGALWDVAGWRRRPTAVRCAALQDAV